MGDAVRRLGLLGAVAFLGACGDPPVRPTQRADVPVAQPAPALTPTLERSSVSPIHAQGSERAALAPAPSVATNDLPQLELKPAEKVATVQAEVPHYAPPESLQKFRYAKAPKSSAPGPVPKLPSTEPPAADVPPPSPAPRSLAAAPVQAIPISSQAVESPPVVALPVTKVATVKAEGDAPRYAMPESLQHWRSGRKVPLYVDPDAAPWQSNANEPRLMNAAVSCNYKDEGGVRGKAMLLVDQNRLTRFTARIEMPNGGVCEFDSKKMAQISFEQGIALQSKKDECVVRMWEQKNRITVAAYSCHKQCSKGSFSYLWPIIMDTRVGTCY